MDQYLFILTFLYTMALELIPSVRLSLTQVLTVGDLIDYSEGKAQHTMLHQCA